jgi:hypothetical protein
MGVAAEIRRGPVTLLDLIFLATFFGTVASLLGIAYLSIRGWGDRARATALRLGAVLALYAAALIGVSFASPGRTVALGEPQCFDEWCIAVTGASRQPAIGAIHARGEFCLVTLRVSSRSRGRRQRERDVYPYLIDRTGRRIEVSPEGQEALRQEGMAGPGLTSFVDPGGSFEVRLAFDVPREANGLAFVKASRSWFPALLIIGDPASFLHRPTRVPLGGA